MDKIFEDSRLEKIHKSMVGNSRWTDDSSATRRYDLEVL